MAAFSTAEESRPVGSPPGILGTEFLAAMESLGVPENKTRTYDFPVRRFSECRQEVMEKMIRLRKEVDPEIVFLPAGSDLHQDHQVVHCEGLRAFKDRTVWGYELPWNQITFVAHAFITLQRAHLDAKWKAMQCYRSQLELGRPYFCWNFVEGLGRLRGVQIKAEFAEAFEVMRVKW